MIICSGKGKVIVDAIASNESRKKEDSRLSGRKLRSSSKNPLRMNLCSSNKIKVN
jgi:hypothetical protein